MDSKWFTRKFVAATLTSTLMVMAWILSQWLTAAREYLPGLLTGLSAVLTAYTAGNVAQDHVLKRASVSKNLPYPDPRQPVEPLPEEDGQ